MRTVIFLFLQSTLTVQVPHVIYVLMCGINLIQLFHQANLECLMWLQGTLVNLELVSVLCSDRCQFCCNPKQGYLHSFYLAHQHVLSQERIESQFVSMQMTRTTYRHGEVRVLG